VPGSPAGRAPAAVPHEHGANVVTVERRDHGQHAELRGEPDLRRQEAEGLDPWEAPVKTLLRILLRLLRVSTGVQAHTRRQGAVAVSAYKRRRA
jgi:hypothetical protein